MYIVYMKIGIYTITNLINGKIYVGFSANMANRKAKHFMDLESKRHSNYYLQLEYNKYGKNNFEFEILEECSREYLASQENYWANMLNVHNKQYGYNILSTNPDYNKIYSFEILERFKNRIGNRKGVKLSERRRLRDGTSKHLKYYIE